MFILLMCASALLNQFGILSALLSACLHCCRMRRSIHAGSFPTNFNTLCDLLQNQAFQCDFDCFEMFLLGFIMICELF